MEERISGIKGTVKEMNTTVKENVKSKKNITDRKHPGNLGHHEKTKSKNNRRKDSQCKDPVIFSTNR